MANREIDQENQQIKPLMTKNKLQSSLVAILAVGVFIGYLSPFGMDEIPVIWSMTYWVITCACGYIIYMPASYYGDKYLVKFIPQHWLRIAISAFFASIVMTFVVPILSWLFFSITINFAKQFIYIFPKCIVIGGLFTFISLLQDYLKAQKAELLAQKELNEMHQAQVEKMHNQPFEKFTALLPVDKRGDLYCLEMADHYVKVYTSKGHHLLLMRFKDALELLVHSSGLQTHRSWWVTKSAITAMNKEGRKVSLSLINGVEVPVSRTYLDKVKAANIL